MRSLPSTVYAAEPGDYILFRSGPRRVERRTRRGLVFIQIRPGMIGWLGHLVPSYPDGKRTTVYLWSDLAGMRVRGVRRGSDS